MIKNRVLAAALALVTMFPSVALAQFAPTPVSPRTASTYRAAIVGLATAAAATDFFTLTGSASKVTQVMRADCSGIGGTAGTADIIAVKRSTANTVGTLTTLPPTPLDSSSPAATAVVRAYTANPTLGALVGSPIHAIKLGLPLAATGAIIERLSVFTFSPPAQPVTLRGVAQVFALNGNATTLAPGALLNCMIEWIEF